MIHHLITLLPITTSIPLIVLPHTPRKMLIPSAVNTLIYLSYLKNLFPSYLKGLLVGRSSPVSPLWELCQLKKLACPKATSPSRSNLLLMSG